MWAPLRDFNAALSLLTTLPTPKQYPEAPGRAFAYFPLVGVVLGCLLWAVQASVGRIATADAAAWVTLLAWVLLTGGLHLDGLGDASDGLFATVSTQRRLDIMKDPRTGTWSVVSLCLVLLGKWVGIRHADGAWLLLAAVAARWVMVAAAYSFPYARADGMGGYYRQGLGRQQMAIASVIMIGLVAFFAGYFAQLLVVLAGAAVVAWWASRRLGGLTGDIYGALCELTETGLLLLLGMGA